MDMPEIMQRCKEILKGAPIGEVCYVHEETGIKGLVLVCTGKDHKKLAQAIDEARKKIGI